jgi:enoyl-CoA hydratase/carnithine racemase
MPIHPKSFLFEHDAATGVATITLNRPERLNALTFDVYAELRDAFPALDADPGVRAIVITGAGRAFCSGGDVDDIIGALFARDAAGRLEFTRMTCDLVRNMRHCAKPVIAALNGTVAGAGSVIALACDFRIAAESTVSHVPEVDLGIPLSWGATPRLIQEVGAARARELSEEVGAPD